ncbi:hypothetical protein [Falsirhodobacter sp. alg1]|uniref:transglycosylase SLT domain-containing protein n=1 Tax=Falsirhodobacter sp. alg1 TaxID=1472418 RepID=UPI00078712F4|nr:hypothetical protein [Falsirhodobacter sp. alg1]
MGRKFLAVASLLFLASCAGNVSQPSNTDNACSILSERRDYAHAMEASERKWGVPIYVQMAVIYQESAFVGDARPPRKWFLGIFPAGRVSSSYGYTQALDGTWEEYQAKEGGSWSRRDRIYASADFVGWYADGTTRALGISKTDVKNQYLAYHEGRTGYSRGTYRNKAWLINVAQRVAARADRYRTQLASCR